MCIERPARYTENEKILNVVDILVSLNFMHMKMCLTFLHYFFFFLFLFLFFFLLIFSLLRRKFLSTFFSIADFCIIFFHKITFFTHTFYTAVTSVDNSCYASQSFKMIMNCIFICTRGFPNTHTEDEWRNREIYVWRRKTRAKENSQDLKNSWRI